MSQDETTETIWTISSLASALKKTVEGSYGTVRVQGELSRVTRASSGHMYFDLKDENAVLHAAWFKGAQRKVPAAMEQGLAVIATGRLTVYPARSEYQLVVSAVEPAGVGALLQLIEERKKKLAAEGLFDAARKRALPYLPRTIGLITSPTGAVLHDMLHRMRDRFMPHVLLWPVAVQGEGAAAQVVEAVEGFNNLPPHIPVPDVLIIARGGGSVEDLMPFNDEALVRAVAASRIPVISAIGHETDWCLMDLAADLRAPTPTGAAELAVPVRAELLATLGDLASRLRTAPLRLLRETRARLPQLRPPRAVLEGLAQRLDDKTVRLGRGLFQWLQARRVVLARLEVRPPQAAVQRAHERLVHLNQRLTAAAQRFPVAPQQKLQRLAEKLEILNYQHTLARGFALALGEDGRPVTRAAEAPVHMTLRFADGQVGVKKV